MRSDPVNMLHQHAANRWFARAHLWLGAIELGAKMTVGIGQVGDADRYEQGLWVGVGAPVGTRSPWIGPTKMSALVAELQFGGLEPGQVIATPFTRKETRDITSYKGGIATVDRQIAISAFPMDWDLMVAAPLLHEQTIGEEWRLHHGAIGFMTNEERLAWMAANPATSGPGWVDKETDEQWRAYCWHPVGGYYVEAYTNKEHPDTGRHLDFVASEDALARLLWLSQLTGLKHEWWPDEPRFSPIGRLKCDEAFTPKDGSAVIDHFAIMFRREWWSVE